MGGRKNVSHFNTPIQARHLTVPPQTSPFTLPVTHLSPSLPPSSVHPSSIGVGRGGRGRPLNSHALPVRLTHFLPAKHTQISRRILLMCVRKHGSARRPVNGCAADCILAIYRGCERGATGTTRAYARM